MQFHCQQQQNFTNYFWVPKENKSVKIVKHYTKWLTPAERLFLAHSWFTIVVDRTELGQVYSIQLKPKYEDPEDERAINPTFYIK